MNEDQAEAARTLDGRLLISAGAGSGKTAVLTARAANAVVPGAVKGWRAVPIDRLLAITFTEKAAGELADRVRGALRAAGSRNEAGRIDGAWISTIHGMCSRILRHSALEAGIDPSFSVLDTVEAGRLSQQAFEAATVALLGGDPALVELFELRDVKTVASTVSALAGDMRTRLLAFADFELELARPAREIVEEAQRTFASATSRPCDAAPEAVAAYAETCGGVAEALGALLAADIGERQLLYDAREILSSIKYPAMRKGLADLKLYFSAEQVRLGKEMSAAITRPLTEALLRLTASYMEEYQRLKSAGSRLDFDDLQSEAFRVLSDDALAAQWKGRFDLTMVDEFQDTDRLQLRLVEFLGGDRLCTVGDEQQSIYRFRGADIAVYREHRAAMEKAGGKRLSLNVNYRSHQEILSFVNRVFGRVFADRLVELRPAQNRSNEIQVGGPRVELMIAPAGGNASGPRAKLADEIASRLLELQDSGVPAGQMAILVPRYTHAGEYADALQRVGMDVLVVGGSRFFDQPEICALRALVRLGANTEDEEALGIVLASRFSGLSDDGLLSLRRTADDEGAGLWPAMGSAPLGPADRRTVEALSETVRAARERVATTPLGEVILRAVEEAGYDAALMSHGASGGQAYANVLKFARLADAFEAAGGMGFTGFSAYLDDKESFGDHEAPATLVKDGSDAVRIMSIHSAKGLEFPVVVVPELGTGGRGSTLAACWQIDSQHARIAVTLPGGSSDQTALPKMAEEIQQSIKDAEREEQQRLLYVACTRAEDVLILAGSCSSSGMPDNMLGVLMRSLEIAPGSPTLPEQTVADLPALRFSFLDGEAEADIETAEKIGPTEEERLSWLEEVIPEPASPTGRIDTRPRRLSYSVVKSYESCPLRFAEEPPARSWDSGQALSFGSAFHAAAQVFGEQGELDEGRVEAIAKFNRLDQKARERLVSALERYRASGAAARVAKLHAIREAPFAVRVGDGDDSFILDGNMDVLAAEGGAALIVDFKTGSRPMGASELLAEYGRQADCYALAALRSGFERAEVVFVRPEVDEGGRPQEVSCIRQQADVARIEAELLAIHRAMGEAPVHLPEYDEHSCRECRVPFGRCAVRDRIGRSG